MHILPVGTAIIRAFGIVLVVLNFKMYNYL